MNLVDEKNDVAFRILDLLKDRFQAFLKFAPVLGARDKRAHIKGEYGLVLQALGHVAPHYSLGQALRDGGFAHAGLADKNGVVLGLAREYADDVSYLGIAADDRIQLVVSGPLHQVGAVFCQRVVGVLRVIRGHRAAADLGQFLGKSVFGYAVVGENALDGRSLIGKYADHQVLHRQIFVAHAFGGLLGGFQHSVGLGRQIYLRGGGAAYLGQTGNGGVKLRQKPVAVHAHLAQQRRDEPAVLIDQGIQQMLRCYILIVVFIRHAFGGFYCFNGFLRIVVGIHCSSLLIQLSGVVFR